MQARPSSRTIGRSRSNLTLNLGLRYSLQLPRTEKYDHQGVFRPDLAQSFPLSTPLATRQRHVAHLGAGAALRLQRRRRQFQVPDAAALSRLRAALRLCLDAPIPVRSSPGIPRRLGALPRADQRLRPASAARFQRHFELRHHGALDHGQSECGHAAGRESAGADSPARPTRWSTDRAERRRRTASSTSNSLYYQPFAFAVSQNYHTPYVENWNTTLTWQVKPATTDRVHLYRLDGHPPVHAAGGHQSQESPD